MDERWAWYWVNKYRWALDQRGDIDQDDLFQAAMIGGYEAEKSYKPEMGEMSTYSAYWIRHEIRRAIGIKNNGDLPPVEIRLDEPLTDDADETRLDMLADDSIPDTDSRLLLEERQRIVREAVERLQQQERRDVVKKLYFEDKPAKQVAAEMGYSDSSRVFKVWDNARRWLRRDKLLKELCGLRHDYHIHVGIQRFNTTQTSAVEAAVIRLEDEWNRIKGALKNELHEK